MSLLMTATRFLAGFRPKSTASVESLHAAIAARGAAAPIPARLRRIATVTEGHVDGFRVVTLTPIAGRSGGHLIYLHGGCYTYPLVAPHWGILAGLIERSGASVTVPLYGLAPEYTVLDALPFLLSVYEREAAAGHRALSIGGDSAGGGLALALAMAARDAGLPQAAAILLISPWLDVTMSNPGLQELSATDPALAAPGLIEAGRLWSAGLDGRDPRVSPLFGDLGGLPPVHTYGGAHDILTPDAHELTRRLRAAGGAATLRIARGGFHDFPGAPWLPEARQALDGLAAVLRA